MDPRGRDGRKRLRKDADKFTLTNAGVLKFTAAKDFEGPDDSDVDGTYHLTVHASDGANTDEVALTVRLGDMDEVAPSLTSASVDGVGAHAHIRQGARCRASVPGTGALAVEVAGVVCGVNAVSVSSRIATLTLASPVTAGGKVTVGYKARPPPVRTRSRYAK